MSEEINQDKKTTQDLEKEKLQAEINILKAKLAVEYPEEEEKEPGWFDKISSYAGKWSAILLSVVALISAIWGVFLPLSEYLAEQRKALEFNLNENMIGFVDDLNSDSAAIANRGIMMLSYYEVNSIPILLFFLESSRNDQKEYRGKIIGTVNLIYEDSNDDAIIEIILRKIENTFTEIKEGHEKDASIDTKRRAMFNYMDLINGMNLRSGDKDDVEDLYEDFKSTICQDPTFKEEVPGLFGQIYVYLGLNEENACE
jgi:hypothetical protein